MSQADEYDVPTEEGIRRYPRDGMTEKGRLLK